MEWSTWKTATIDIDRASEFSGDDVDQYSSLVDLGSPYDTLVIFSETLTTSPINVYVQRLASTAIVPKPVHHGQVTGAAWGTAIWVTTGGAGDNSITCPIGGHQYVRIRCTTNQETTDKTIYVRGTRS